mmetsp:Transcript_17716/g.49586  ORF Transcript_17716/g.49586 Transcript_17716/m.49586 type:complete len:269 (-) Transcript_17716:26-832(-)
MGFSALEKKHFHHGRHVQRGQHCPIRSCHHAAAGRPAWQPSSACLPDASGKGPGACASTTPSCAAGHRCQLSTPAMNPSSAFRPLRLQLPEGLQVRPRGAHVVALPLNTQPDEPLLLTEAVQGRSQPKGALVTDVVRYLGLQDAEDVRCEHIVPKAREEGVGRQGGVGHQQVLPGKGLGGLLRQPGDPEGGRDRGIATSSACPAHRGVWVAARERLKRLQHTLAGPQWHPHLLELLVTQHGQLPVGQLLCRKQLSVLLHSYVRQHLLH